MGFLSDFWNGLFRRNERLAAERLREQQMLADLRLEESRQRIALERQRLAQDAQLRQRELKVHREDLNAQRPLTIRRLDSIVKVPQPLVGRPKTIPIQRLTRPR